MYKNRIVTSLVCALSYFAFEYACPGYYQGVAIGFVSAFIVAYGHKMDRENMEKGEKENA
jgi:hypothetical protein